MQTSQNRLKLNKPLTPHAAGILGLTLAAQEIMGRVGRSCERCGLTRPQYKEKDQFGANLTEQEWIELAKLYQKLFPNQRGS